MSVESARYFDIFEPAFSLALATLSCPFPFGRQSSDSITL